MNNRLIFYFIIATSVAVCILLFINFLAFFNPGITEKYLPIDKVRGMAIEHKNKLYTLNYEQQVLALRYLNQSIPAGNEDLRSAGEKPDFERIIIYRFGEPETIITPITYDQRTLIFSAPDWNPNSYLKEFSNGELVNLLSRTYPQ